MTDAEIKQAEIIANSHLNRCRSLQARIVDTHGNSNTQPGIVPSLCETILKLTAELKQARGKTR